MTKDTISDNINLMIKDHINNITPNLIGTVKKKVDNYHSDILLDDGDVLTYIRCFGEIVEDSKVLLIPVDDKYVAITGR